MRKKTLEDIKKGFLLPDVIRISFILTESYRTQMISKLLSTMGLTIFVLNHSHVRNVGDLLTIEKDLFIFFTKFFCCFFSVYWSSNNRIVKVISMILPEKDFNFFFEKDLVHCLGRIQDRDLLWSKDVLCSYCCKC